MPDNAIMNQIPAEYDVMCIFLVCSVQVSCYMKNDRSDIVHQYDVFHTAKGLTKQLWKASRNKDNEDVAMWIQSIINHLWWSCATCGGDENV